MASIVDGWRPELHPRDEHGRFRNKWKLASAAAALIDGIIAKFDPKTFSSDVEARDYLRQKGGHDYGKHLDPAVTDYLNSGWHDTNAKMRAGTEGLPPGLEKEFKPSEDDLILSRAVGPEAFGLNAQQLDGVQEWTGRLVADKAPGNASIGTPLQSGPGTINLAILAPKGTKMIIPGNGSPDVVYEPRQALRITKVTGDAQNGIHVWAVMTPNLNNKGQPVKTRALGRKLTSAEKAASDQTDVNLPEAQRVQAQTPPSMEDRVKALEEKLATTGGKAGVPAAPTPAKRAKRVPKPPLPTDQPPEGEAPSKLPEKTAAGSATVAGLRATALRSNPTPQDAARLRDKLDGQSVATLRDAAKSLEIKKLGTRKQDIVDKIVDHVYGKRTTIPPRTPAEPKKTVKASEKGALPPEVQALRQGSADIAKRAGRPQEVRATEHLTAPPVKHAAEPVEVKAMREAMDKAAKASPAKLRNAAEKAGISVPESKKTSPEIVAHVVDAVTTGKVSVPSVPAKKATTKAVPSAPTAPEVPAAQTPSGATFKEAFTKASKGIGLPEPGPRRAEFNRAYFKAARGKFAEAHADLKEDIDKNQATLDDLKANDPQSPDIAKLDHDLRAQIRLAAFINDHSKGTKKLEAPKPEAPAVPPVEDKGSNDALKAYSTTSRVRKSVEADPTPENMLAGAIEHDQAANYFRKQARLANERADLQRKGLESKGRPNPDKIKEIEKERAGAVKSFNNQEEAHRQAAASLRDRAKDESVRRQRAIQQAGQARTEAAAAKAAAKPKTRFLLEEVNSRGGTVRVLGGALTHADAERKHKELGDQLTAEANKNRRPADPELKRHGDVKITEVTPDQTERYRLAGQNAMKKSGDEMLQPADLKAKAAKAAKAAPVGVSSKDVQEGDPIVWQPPGESPMLGHVIRKGRFTYVKWSSGREEPLRSDRRDPSLRKATEADVKELGGPRLADLKHRDNGTIEPPPQDKRIDPATYFDVNQPSYQDKIDEAQGAAKLAGQLQHIAANVDNKDLPRHLDEALKPDTNAPTTHEAVARWNAAVDLRGDKITNRAELNKAIDKLAEKHGLKPIGEAGDTVPYNPRLHQGSPDMKPGERVRVDVPGYWRTKGADDPRAKAQPTDILAKAQVSEPGSTIPGVPKGHVLKPTEQLPSNVQQAIKTLGNGKPADLRKAADKMGIPVPENLKTSDEIARHVVADMAGKELSARGRNSEVEARIKTAYAELRAKGDVNNRYVGMADLRDKVGKDVSREEFDAAIKRFARDQNSGVRVVPVANMKALTERDRAAAVKIGDEDNHMIDVVPEGVVSGNTAGAPAPALAATTSSLDAAINAARKDMPDGSPGRQTLDKLDRIDRFDPTATSAAADMLDNTAASFRRHASMTLANSPKGSPQANRAEAQLKAADHLENVAKQLRRPTVDARSSATRAVVLQTVAGRQEHIRELEITASKLKPGSSEHSAAMKAIEADRAWIAQHGAGKAPPVASEQAVQSAREQLAAKVTKDLGQAVSKDEARALLAGRTRQELVDIAKAGGTVHPSGATKQQIADTIINNQVGRRLTSDAIRGASRTPGLSVPNVKPQHHAVTAPRTNMVGEMVHQLTQAKTEEDRKRLLEAKTGPTLRAIGQDRGFNFGDGENKKDMVAKLLDHFAGRTGKEVVAGKMSDKPILENHWGTPGGPVNFHDDGVIGSAIRDMGADSHLNVEGEPLANVLGKLATAGVRGDRTSQEVLDELKSLRDRMPEGSKAKSAIANAVRRMDNGTREPLPLPQGTPAPLVKLMEDFSKIPLARGNKDEFGRKLPNEMDKLAEIVSDWREGKLTGSRFIDQIEQQLLNNRHENKEGKFEIDRKVRRALDELKAMHRADRKSLHPPELPGGGAAPKAPSAPERTFLDPFNRLDLKKYAQERHGIDLNQFLDLTRNPLPLAHAPVAEQRPFGYRLQKIIDDAASGNASHNKTISELDKAIHTAKEQVQFIRISDPKRHDNRDKATLEQGPKYIQALGDVVKGLQAEKLPARKTRPTLPPTVAGQLAPVDEGKFSSHPLNDLLSHGGQSLPAGFAHRLERNGLRVASAKNLETNPQRPGLSKEENRALDIWTATPVAGALNGSLRLGHPVHGTQEFPERPDLGKVNLDEVQSQLDRAIQKSELRHDSVLWRGVLVKNADAKRFVPGAVYSDPGFSATSASQNRAERVAERWSREVQHKGSKPVLFKILAPKGTHAALGHQSVEEILLGRDQRFQVVRIEEPTTRDGLPTYVVQALRPDHVEGRDLLASTDFAKLTSNSANLGSGIGGKGPDEALRKILAEQHFDAKPKILTPEEMDHAIKVDGGVELFRAVGAHEEKTPAQLAEEFRSGTLHPGTGVYGSGTYATPERDVTKNYGEEQLRMVLPPSARTVSYPNLVKLRDAQFADLEAQAKALRLDLRKAADDPAKLKAIQAELNHLQARRNVIYNPGRLAALLGYDAIVVPQGFRKGPKSGGASEYVILNRSAMLVEKARKG